METPAAQSRAWRDADSTSRFCSVHHVRNRQRSAPRTLLERNMDQLSCTIRQKEHWWHKVHDDEVVSNWKAEATLEEAAFTRVVDELRHMAMHRVSSGCRPAPVDGVFESDLAVPPAVLAQLQASARELAASIPRDEHPGSDGLVIDLVHPSLYPLISDLSTVDMRFAHGEALTLLPPKPRRYQWLPSIFDVAADGDVRISSYINNLDPEKAPRLQPAIAAAFSAVRPLLEEVLTELQRVGSMRSAERAVDFDMYNLWEDEEEYAERVGPAAREGSESGEDEEYWDEYAENKQIARPPLALPFVPPELPPPACRISLAGRQLRVITKLANIELTPAQPRYAGGTWHVEGEEQEAIVATALVYYDCDNITESRLAFRRMVDADDVQYEQDDRRGVEAVYGFKLDRRHRSATVTEELGAIVARQGRAVAFPNTMQHAVRPFELADKARPGHRKILAFFLVDPAMRIASTREVHPQQQEALFALLGTIPRFASLPDAVRAEVVSRVDTVFSRKDAEEHRCQLMDARRSAQEALQEDFEADFSLCEH